MKQTIFIYVTIIIALALFGIYAVCQPVQDQVVVQIDRLQAIPESEQEIINSCSNLTLQKTASCLRSNILPIYSYNLTDDFKFLTFDNMKKTGGDCYDWSRLYLRLINKMPEFYGEIKRIPIGYRVSHAITIISDDTGYCVLDLINPPECWTFIKSEEIEEYQENEGLN